MNKRYAVTLLVVAEILGMSLWFVSSAVISDIRLEVHVSDIAGAWLASSVPGGFVIGALFLAITGLADRFDPRKVFAVSVVLAAICNASMVLFVPGDFASIASRFFTGLFLAGVYPVGMKIAVGWGTGDRGLLVGLLVGGLAVGSASPHLLAWFGGAAWRLTTLVASALALLSALPVLLTQLGPHHAAASKFDAGAIKLAWTDKRIRMAFAGYFGHMWELYAMWAWIAPAVAVSYAFQMPSSDALALSKLTAFFAIAGGALLCPVAGYYADRIGKARLTIIAMVCSCASALLTAVVFGGPVWLVFIVVLLWGFSVIPDSAQFSALVADYAPADKAGSLMSLQTALGFALTMVVVQVAPLLANTIGWPAMFCILALGPAFGVWSMRQLQKEKGDGAVY